MQAIDTFYKGYRFRSRLEARWAVYFDQVGVSWEYEPAGFNLGNKLYLPDFFLPEFGTYIEVKPTLESKEKVFSDMVAMIESGASSVGSCLAVFGDPLNHKLMAVGRIDNGQPWHDDFCDQTAISFDVSGDEKMICPTFNLSAAEKVSLKLKRTASSLIDNYKEKLYARCVRFEHGERP